MLFFIHLIAFLTFSFIPTTPISAQSGLLRPDHADLGAQFNTTDGPVLSSPNATFDLWPSGCNFLGVVHTSKTIVWEASPLRVSATNCSLILAEDGDLVLSSSVSGEKVWSSNTSGMGARSLQILESGNLVLLDSSNLTIWQSFDSPTDTLLQGQAFKPGMKLTSATSTAGTTYSFSYKGSDAFLFASFDGGTVSVPYWMVQQTYSDSSKPAAYITFESGNLNWYANDSTFVALSNFENLITAETANYMWRAQLGTDGNLQATFWANSEWNPAGAGRALTNDCQKPDHCGPYGICTGQGQCQCPSPSLQQVSSDPSQGCKPVEPLNCTANLTLVNLTGVDYFSNQFSAALQVSSQECQRLCLANCSCEAAFYHENSSSCYNIDHLRTMQQFTSGTNTSSMVFLKASTVPSSSGVLLPPGAQPGRSNTTPLIVAVVIVGSVLVLGLFCLALYWCYTIKKRKAEIIDDERFLQSLTALPPRFSYKEMTTATKTFSQKLGKGAFGSVYEGVLPDKNRVAVKRLEEAGEQGRKQFRAEIATIGCICHLNVVRLRGFCLESKHRLLVYEFMANGSLEKALFADVKSSGPSKAVLGWDARYQIALGTARGLAYLHEECIDRIIHCDIKPDNILLDDKNMAKLADFGLSKLVDRQESKVLTQMRGTRGYLAPEWLSNVPIGEKTDVYSFGMVLLELVSGRRISDKHADPEKYYLPTWAFSIAKQGRDFMELVDGRLDTHTIDEEQLGKLIAIGLWCIQEDMNLRPTMGVVVKMLEGLLEVLSPPIPSDEEIIRKEEETIF